MQRSPGGTVGGPGQRVGCDLEVGVGQHDGVVFRAAERLHALAVLGRRLVDVSRDRRRAHERNRLDAGVREDRVHRLRIAVHHIQHAIRKSRFLEQLRQSNARGRDPSPKA